MMALMTPTRTEDVTAQMAPTDVAIVQHPLHAMIAPISAPPPDMPLEQEQPLQTMALPEQSVASPQPATPKQMSAVQRYEDRLAQKQMSDFDKDENPYGSANNHPGFFGKVLHGLSVATGGPNRRLMSEAKRNDQIEGIEQKQGAQALQGAQASAAQQEGDLHEQQARAAELTPATQEEADKYDIPLGTPLNAAIRGSLGKQHGIDNTKIQTTGMTVQGRQNVADANNLTKQTIAQLKPEQRDDRAIHLMEKPAAQRTPEENAYLGAYGRWVQQTKTDPGVARAQAFAMFHPVQVLGDDGNVQYQTAGNAIKGGLSTPQSMNFRTAAGMAKFMTSGKGGQTITAYNTANDHLELLGKAMDALQNGDVQGLNQLNNAFKQQFGSAAPTNVNAVKAMLAGELANVAKVTGATDQEIKVQQDNINRAASPEQIKGFIDTNRDLMDQKAYELYQQYQQGLQGKAAFNTGLSGHRAASGAGSPPPGAKIIKWEDVK